MPNQCASSSKEHQDLIVVGPSLDLTEAFPTILKSLPPRLRDPHLGDRDQLSTGPLPVSAAADPEQENALPVLAA